MKSTWDAQPEQVTRKIFWRYKVIWMGLSKMEDK